MRIATIPASSVEVSYSMPPEYSLWAAVLLRGILDYQNRHKIKSKKERFDLELWMTSEDRKIGSFNWIVEEALNLEGSKKDLRGLVDKLARIKVDFHRRS